MASLRERFADWVSGGALSQMREYMLGQGAFSRFEQQYGRDKEMFSPAEYGNYIATSNAIYTCVTIRAELLSSLPLRFYKIRNGQKMEVDSGRLWELFAKINPYWTLSRLIKMTSYSLDLWGVSYWFLERGDSRRQPPREIWWARPDRVKVIPHQSDYISGFSYTPPQGGGEIKYTPQEVVWMPNPNPVDEFSGLAPLAAARLAADTASVGMETNKRIFDQGLMVGGLLNPPKDMTFTDLQAKELERNMDARFAGRDKAHRIGVLRFHAEFQNPLLTPRDIEWMDGLKWSLEECCRAYRIPLDLVGGQRTYQNFEAAMKAVWTNAIIPQSIFVAEEVTEKLLPLFPNDADYAEFDKSKVEVLQEDRSEIITQMKELWGMGVPLNPLLNEFQPNLLPPEGKYPWGDTWWAPIAVLPVGSGQPSPVQSEAAIMPSHSRAVEYGSPTHERLWRIQERRISQWEKRFIIELKELFRRQKDSVIDRLKQPARSIDDAITDPFDMPQWIKSFRLGISPVLQEMMADVGQAEFDYLGLALLFNIDAPEIVRFMEGRAQRFATAVNETTWNEIRAAISTGLKEGEGIPKMESRLTTLFNQFIGEPAVAEKMSRVEMIARTEVVGASSGGSIEAWKQSGVVEKKAWLAALDLRTRDTHIEAHREYQANPILLHEDFTVGLGTGQGPGLINRVEEVVNCRCTMQPIISERFLFGNNGHSRYTIKELEHVKELFASLQ